MNLEGRGIAGGGEGRHNLAQIGIFYCDTNHNSCSKWQETVLGGFFFFFFFLAAPRLSCGMRDLVLLPLHGEPRALPLDYQGSPRNR